MAKANKPVSKEQSIEIEIIGLNHEGEGVGRINGFTIFVPHTAPGDLVLARVISIQKNYARALFQEIIKPSSSRREAPCPQFYYCGGCQLQHIDYKEQLRLKHINLEETLQRIGGIETEVSPIRGMNDPWFYRNKAQVPIGQKDNNILIGFYAKKSHRIINMEKCLIQDTINNQAISIVRGALQSLNIPVYNPSTQEGVIRHVLTRSSFYNGEVMIALITINNNAIPHQDELVDTLKKRIKGLTGIIQNVNPSPGNVVLGHQNILLWGNPYITEKIGDYFFKVSPSSFFQVNPPQTEVLYELVDHFSELNGDETVFDLYCGIGTISIYLSKKAGKVIGVESVQSAIDDACLNAEENRVSNVSFYSAKAEKVLPDMAKKYGSPNVVVVDPPRKGCHHELLSSISELQPAKIIYVSCNPATLARDLNYLSQSGFSVQKIQPVDMFPHTSHIESVVQIVNNATS